MSLKHQGGTGATCLPTLRLVMDLRDGYHILPSTHANLKRDKTPDPIELLREIGDDVVKYLLS